MLSRELLRPPNDITIDCDAVLQRQQGQLSINMAARSRQIVTDQLIDSSRLLADLRHTPIPGAICISADTTPKYHPCSIQVNALSGNVDKM